MQILYRNSWSNDWLVLDRKNVQPPPDWSGKKCTWCRYYCNIQGSSSAKKLIQTMYVYMSMLSLKWNVCFLSSSWLGLFHLKEYGRGGKTFFFRPSLPHFIFFDWTPLPHYTIMRWTPPPYVFFMVFASILNIEIPCKTPLPHFLFFDWTPPPSLNNYRLDPPSLLAFLKKSSTPPPCILLHAIALINNERSLSVHYGIWVIITQRLRSESHARRRIRNNRNKTVVLTANRFQNADG